MLCWGFTAKPYASQADDDPVMRQLPDDLANLLKDGLRGARYVVRRGTRRGQDAMAFVPVVPEVVRLADSMLTATEKTASVLLLRDHLAFEGADSVQDAFAALRGAADEAPRKRLFVRLHYRLIEAVLKRLGIDNAFISEHEIAAAYDVMHRRQRRVLATLKAGRDANAAATRFWVAAAVTLAARHPLREFDLPRRAGDHAHFLEQAPTPYCLLIVALTGAILTTRLPARRATGAPRPVGDGIDSYIDSAAAVVSARFERFAAVLTQADAVEVLAGAFDTVLPFLP